MGVTTPQFKMLYLKWQVCFSTVLETGNSKVSKLPGLVPHESQYSVLQMPVFSSGCILTARTGPGTSHFPIPEQWGGGTMGGRDSTGRDRTKGSGTPDRWHTTTRPSRSHLRTELPLQRTRSSTLAGVDATDRSSRKHRHSLRGQTSLGDPYCSHSNVCARAWTRMTVVRVKGAAQGEATA